jgi:hypothetical protein
MSPRRIATANAPQRRPPSTSTALVAYAGSLDAVDAHERPAQRLWRASSRARRSPPSASTWGTGCRFPDPP